MEIFDVVWHRYNQEDKYIIGYLIYDNKWFFRYNQIVIKAAIKKGFRPFPELSRLNETYHSNRLFRTFSSRINGPQSDIEILRKTDSKLLTDNILVLRK